MTVSRLRRRSFQLEILLRSTIDVAFFTRVRRGRCGVNAVVYRRPARLAEATGGGFIMPELIMTFAAEVHGVVIACKAKRELGQRFGLRVRPIMNRLTKGETLGLIANIQNWSIHIVRIAKLIRRPRRGSTAGVKAIVAYHRSHGVRL
ncbi:hydrogenase accessory protein [Bradyrhizobium iriomotense]|uniref:hydrogenase accessory protein n=1 Tax=Bradyrhizobium iriomotense TaxID=441950 RepID=UPI003D67BF15